MIKSSVCPCIWVGVSTCCLRPIEANRSQNASPSGSAGLSDFWVYSKKNFMRKRTKHKNSLHKHKQFKAAYDQRRRSCWLIEPWSLCHWRILPLLLFKNLPHFSLFIFGPGFLQALTHGFFSLLIDFITLQNAKDLQWCKNWIVNKMKISSNSRSRMKFTTKNQQGAPRPKWDYNT